MTKPACFNRPAFKNTVVVQNGWTDDGRRNMVEIVDPMTKTCQQHGPLGEATLHGWDCAGCAHAPEKPAAPPINPLFKGLPCNWSGG